MYEIKFNDEIKNGINSAFLVALKNSNVQIETVGATSSKKVNPIHKWVAESLEIVLGGDFVAYAATHRRFPNGSKDGLSEPKVQGKYFDKNVDVAVVHKDTPKLIEAVVEVKYYSGNLSQNENNNIENMLGYTSNVRGNDMLFSYFIVAKTQTPYYDKTGKLIKWENHSIGEWAKYENILKEPKSSLHRPDAISIILTSDGTEFEMNKYIKKDVVIKGSDLRKDMLNESLPKFVASPNIKSNFLEMGPADFIISYAIKILAHHSDNY